MKTIGKSLLLLGIVGLMLVAAPVRADVFETFDDLTKTSYSPDTTWHGFHLTNAICDQWKAYSGHSVRLNQTSPPDPYLEYVGDDGNGKDGGVGVITFLYRPWRTATACLHKVMVSVGGAAYDTIGTINTSDTTQYWTFTYTLNNTADNIRIKVLRMSGERLLIDNFSITDYGADTEPPTISTITVISNSAIDVLFSEQVEQTTAETESNYVVDQGVGNPVSALRDATNHRLVHLTFNTMPNNTYTLTVNGVQDLAGNPAVNATGQFTIQVTADPGDVIISEIMYDDTASVDAEWVEIHNRTGDDIDISNWALIDAPVYPVAATEGGIVVPAGTILPASAYLVLSKVALPELTGEVVCTQYRGSWTLGNNGDNLALYTDSTAGILIDGVVTSDTTQFYPANVVGNSGTSLEKCDVNTGWTSNVAAWHGSTNVFATSGRYRYCTPGAANTVCPPDATPPTLVSATVVTNMQVNVLFSEAVERFTAQTVGNYSVDNGVGSPSTAIRQSTLATVALTFPSVLPPNTYTLTVNNVTDLAANPIAANSTIQFTVTPPPYTMKYVEVMPNPAFAGLTDSLGEWFEIYNLGANTVDLTGWVIADGSGRDTVESGSIAPGQYFVFCCKGDSAVNGGVPVDFAYRYGTSGWGLALSNTGETLTLRDALGNIVASVAYTGYPFAAGQSCQLRDPSLDPSVAANWCIAETTWAGAWNGDHGTPQHATICPQPIVPDTVTICDIRQQDACGVPVRYQTRVVTRGVITFVDTCRRTAYMQSGGCGVAIYGAALLNIMQGSTNLPAAGDSVMVDGYITQYRGLTEINTYSTFTPVITFLGGGHTWTPVDVPCSDIASTVDNCAAETYESRQVRVSGLVFLASGTFAGDSNYATLCGADTVYYRIDSCDALLGTAIPTGPMIALGVVTQFDSVSCYCGGYQLAYAGGTAFTPAQCVTPISMTAYRTGPDSVTLMWQPGPDQMCNCYEIYFTNDASAAFPGGYNYLAHVTGVTRYVDVGPYVARRIYVVTAGGPHCP